MEPSDCLAQFLDDVPTLGLVGNKELVEPRRQYVIDDDVQLVCKYLKAYETGGKNGIDKLYKEGKEERVGGERERERERERPSLTCTFL